MNAMPNHVKLTESLVSDICNEMRKGTSKTEACEMNDIPRQTLHRWENEHLWVKNAVKDAVNGQLEKYQDQAASIRNSSTHFLEKFMKELLKKVSTDPNGIDSVDIKFTGKDIITLAGLLGAENITNIMNVNSQTSTEERSIKYVDPDDTDNPGGTVSDRYEAIKQKKLNELKIIEQDSESVNPQVSEDGLEHSANKSE